MPCAVRESDQRCKKEWGNDKPGGSCIKKTVLCGTVFLNFSHPICLTIFPN